MLDEVALVGYGINVLPVMYYGVLRLVLGPFSPNLYDKLALVGFGALSGGQACMMK